MRVTVHKLLPATALIGVLALPAFAQEHGAGELVDEADFSCDAETVKDGFSPDIRRAMDELTNRGQCCRSLQLCR